MFIFIPAAGLYSNIVMTGPGLISTTLPFTPKSESFSSIRAAFPYMASLSISTAVSILGSSRSKDGREKSRQPLLGSSGVSAFFSGDGGVNTICGSAAAFSAGCGSFSAGAGGISALGAGVRFAAFRFRGRRSLGTTRLTAAASVPALLVATRSARRTICATLPSLVSVMIRRERSIMTAEMMQVPTVPDTFSASSREITKPSQPPAGA